LLVTPKAEDLMVRYYLDDVTIIGEHAQIFSKKFREISELFGFELPEEKSHLIIVRKQNNEITVDPFDAFTHLGINILHENNNIVMKCIQKLPPEIQAAAVSKRIGFQIAGYGTDALYLHARRQSAADLLRRLTGSAREWDETLQINKATFVKLAHELRPINCSHAVLTKPYKSIDIFSDASNAGFGYVIKCDDIIIYERSRLWGKAQTKWDINRKELFSIMECMLAFHELHNHCLPVPVHLYTDSKVALAWIHGGSPAGAFNSRTKILVERWLEFINQLPVIWKTNIPTVSFCKIAGGTNPADMPSRLPQILAPSLLETPGGGEVVTLARSLQEDASASRPLPQLRPLHTLMLTSLFRAAQLQSTGLELQRKYLRTGECSGVSVMTLREMTKFRFLNKDILCELHFPDGDIAATPTATWIVDISTPLGEEIVSFYAKTFHEEAGHSSVRHTAWRLSKFLTSHGLKRKVKNVIAECAHCQIKARLLARRAAYLVQRRLDSSAKRFFQTVSIDMFTVPTNKNLLGMKYVLVLIDHFSRFCLMAALRDKRGKTIESTLHKWCETYTTPECIRSDNEPVFRWMDQKSSFRNVWQLIAQYSPFSNGICERVMASVKEFVLVNARWVQHLHFLQRKMNSKKLPEGYSPFQVVFGKEFEGEIHVYESNIDDEFENRQAERDTIANEITRSREMRQPSRPPPVKTTRFEKGDFVVRTYDEARRPVVVSEVISPQLVKVVDLKEMKQTKEHVRNLHEYGLVDEVPHDVEPGGADVESSAESIAEDE
jgi:transposase InsO family protein